MLATCRADSASRSQFSCRCCRVSQPPNRRMRSSPSTAGTATASCPAIISRRATACRSTRTDRRRGTRRVMTRPILPLRARAFRITAHRATGGAAAATISAIQASTTAALTAAASVRAGPTRRSERCGIAASLLLFAVSTLWIECFFAVAEFKLRRAGFAERHRAIEARAAAGVAGRDRLFDLDPDGVLVAIDAHLDDALNVARGLALLPQRAARAAVVPGFAGSN